MVYFDEAVESLYRNRREMPRYNDRKMEITVFETREYTAEGAWAHTVPGAQTPFMCILPPELRDYRLPIHKHEALHNVHENGLNEGFVTAYAMNPASDVEFYNRARLVKR